MTETTAVVHSDPEIMSGTPVFVGTRVPVKCLFDYLEGGDGLDGFLDDFPSVSREQVVAALEIAQDALLAAASGNSNQVRALGVVHSDPEILGGTPVFVGTRVPVRTLIDHLAAGDGLEVVLDGFPSLSREQTLAALEIAQDALSASAYAHARPSR